MEARDRLLPSPQGQTPFVTSQSTEKHKSEIPKSRSGDFSRHSTGAAQAAQETNFGDLAPMQPMPAKERKAKEKETQQAERAGA